MWKGERLIKVNIFKFVAACLYTPNGYGTYTYKDYKKILPDVICFQKIVIYTSSSQELYNQSKYFCVFEWHKY